MSCVSPIGLSLLTFGGVIFCWISDVSSESKLEGNHTTYVRLNLRMGMLLFIISEIMFFCGFFWAFFHSSVTPVIEVGSIWPPYNVSPISSVGIPTLNTVILLLSGAFVTWAHHSLLEKSQPQALLGLLITISLALIFTFFQGFEYIDAISGVSDGIYGSTFFLSTGFHGLHVIIGTIMLSYSLYRILNSQCVSTLTQHFGLEASIWYWHFVDIVWLFLFISIYWWGYNASTLMGL